MFQDLTDFLHIPENHKMLMTIKGNVERLKRMTENTARNKLSMQPSMFASHANHSSNVSICSTGSNVSIPLPTMEPDYGIIRERKPRYFKDAQQAISCLFQTFKL